MFISNNKPTNFTASTINHINICIFITRIVIFISSATKKQSSNPQRLNQQLDIFNKNHYIQKSAAFTSYSKYKTYKKHTLQR